MIIKKVKVPTGNILIVRGQSGKLECLSLGDYGKQANIKADFLGLRDEINGVSAKEIMPLSEKWVITVSTQYGCSMGCNFCDVPKVGKGLNAMYSDLETQVEECLKLHPEIKRTKRLNVHFARMGEPTFNPDVLVFSELGLPGLSRKYLGESLVHPVVSTMMPRMNRFLPDFLSKWVDLKNNLYKGDAGLQLSINSTSDKERETMFNGNSMSLKEISALAESLPAPVGRKYALNFAVCGYETDGKKLAALFDPRKFMCKITPMHETKACRENGFVTEDGYNYYYPYKEAEESLKEAGFDVLVFIPSKDEDESGITCGNAILAEIN